MGAGIDVLRKAAARCYVRDIDAKHRAGVFAPIQDVGIKMPFIGNITERPQNLCGVGPKT